MKIKEQSLKYIINNSEEERNMDFFGEQNPNEKYGAKPPIFWITESNT